MLLAAILILSGAGKLASPEATLGYIDAVSLPFPHLAFFDAVAVELVGGTLLVVGRQTRVVAAALAVFSLITAVIFHGPIGDQNHFIHLLKTPPWPAACCRLSPSALAPGALTRGSASRQQRPNPRACSAPE